MDERKIVMEAETVPERKVRDFIKRTSDGILDKKFFGQMLYKTIYGEAGS
jgi:hypothetical protein